MFKLYLVRFIFIPILLFSSCLASSKNTAQSKLWKRLKVKDFEDQSQNHHYNSILKYFETKKLNPTPKTVNQPTKNKPREISLPFDYNKLEVPKLEKVSFEGSSAQLNHDTLRSNVLPVEVDVTVRKIRNLDQIQEAITVELDFSAKWLDYVILQKNKENWDQSSNLRDRKVFTNSIRSLDAAFLRRIWKPDLFIEDATSIQRPGVITSPVRLLFSPTGFIVYSTRITVKVNCAMELKYYPADTQICRIKIRSYSYTTSDLNITWGKPGPFFLDRSDDNFYLKLNMLDPVNVVESEGIVHDTYRETYRVLQFEICARRKLSYHLMQTFLPSVFFIFITWLSFLVPVTMVEARIGISMTTLLTLTSMFAAVRESTPTLSYIKAIDIWMVACIFFVFLTLLELTILACRRHLRTTAALSPARGNVYAELINNDENVDSNLNDRRNSRLGEQRRYSRVLPPSAEELAHELNDQKIEKYAFLGFLLLFIVFNLIYWPWLLLASEYLVWNLDYAYNAVRA